jgi:hypothetical protein
MECLILGLDIFKRSIQTSVVNSHTVAYKPIALADNPAQLEFNCSGHSDYYIDLNSVRLLLRIKPVKTDGSDIENTASSTGGCVNNLLHSVFSSLRISLNEKPFTFQTKYNYKAYIEKLLNYGSDASITHLISSFWYLESPWELTEKTCYAKRLNYLSNGEILEVYGGLHADLFNSGKMLIDGVDLIITLTRAPDAFYLLAPSDVTRYV